MFGSVTTGIVALGLSSATYRYFFQYREDRAVFRVLNTTNLAFLVVEFVLLGVLVYLLADWISVELFDRQLSSRLVIGSYCSGCLEYFITYFILLLTAESRALPFLLVTMFKVSLNTSLSLFFIFTYSYTFMARILGILCTQVVVAFLLAFLNRDHLILTLSYSSLKKSLKFGYPDLLNNSISMLYVSFDKVVLNKYKGAASLGYYDIGAKIAVLMKMVIDSVERSFSPYFLTKARENTQSAKQDITARFFEVLFLYMVVGLCIICFSEELIVILTTSQFYPAKYIVPLYVIYYLFGVPGQLATGQIMHCEKKQYLIPSSVVSLVINIILNILLIPRFGAIGAVIAIVISALFSGLILFYFGQHLFPLPLKKWRLATPYIILGILTGLVYISMGVEFNFFLKISTKLTLIASFIWFGLQFGYLPKERVVGILRNLANVKH